MKRRILLAVFTVFFLSVIFTGCFSSESEEESGSKNVTTQNDADIVALGIRTQLLNAAPHYATGTTTWNDTVEHGSVSGTATISGSFTKTSSGYPDYVTTYKYNNVSIILNNFCDDDFYPALTGSALIYGTAMVDSSYSGNVYSGYWYITGSAEMSGAYTGTMSFNLYIYKTGSDHSGTIVVEGKSWSVSDM
ncbi:MAG: hypothetical protein V1874_16895 [Spirochaetota bacterium]